MTFFYSVQGQNQFFIQSSGGFVSMPFWYGSEIEDLTGMQLSFESNYLYKSYITGFKFTHFSHSSVINPGRLELEYNNDISVVTYGNEFYQKTSNLNYITLSIIGGYNFKISDFFRLQMKYGISYIKGNKSRTILSSPGDNIPTNVGYTKRQRSEIALGYYSVTLLGKLSKLLSIGLDFNYQDVLKYKGISLVIQTKL